MRRALRVLAILVALTALPLLVHARAGGGQSYSGGSHSGGYSGYSGGSSYGGSSYSSSGGDFFVGQLIVLYIEMVVAHPVGGIPVTLFLLYLFYQGGNVGVDRYKGGVIADGLEMQDHHDMAKNLGQLKARDPLFDATGFLSRAQKAFLKIQQAWSAGDMTPARSFVSDGVMVRFAIQLEMNQADGKRNKVDQVRILDSEILEVESDQHFDALHVRVRASAVDQDFDKDGSVSGGSSTPAEFEEVWTFLRRPGAKTLGRPGLIEGCCPNCGAPLPLLDAARCDQCKSWVNTGEFDWVLSEITQACEWTPRDPELEVPGLVSATEADPDLNVQFLEERGAVAFWRWQQALSNHDVAPLKCMAPPDFLDTFGLQIAQKAP